MGSDAVQDAFAQIGNAIDEYLGSLKNGMASAEKGTVKSRYIKEYARKYRLAPEYLDGLGVGAKKLLRLYLLRAEKDGLKGGGLHFAALFLADLGMKAKLTRNFIMYSGDITGRTVLYGRINGMLDILESYKQERDRRAQKYAIDKDTGDAKELVAMLLGHYGRLGGRTLLPPAKIVVAKGGAKAGFLVGCGLLNGIFPKLEAGPGEIVFREASEGEKQRLCSYSDKAIVAVHDGKLVAYACVDQDGTTLDLKNHEVSYTAGMKNIADALTAAFLCFAVHSKVGTIKVSPPAKGIVRTLDRIGLKDNGIKQRLRDGQPQNVTGIITKLETQKGINLKKMAEAVGHG